MINKRKVLISIVLFLLLMGSPVNALKNEAAGSKEPQVTIMLFRTDLREALNEISLQTGVNIIPDQTVNGIVSVDLEEVPLEKALKRILISGGYTFKKIEDFYFVGLPDPKSNTFGKLSEVEVIKLKNIKAREVEKLLPDFLADYVQASDYSDLLTINAPPKEIKKITKLVNKLDQPLKQVKVKLVITEIKREENKELGNQLFNFKSDETGKEEYEYDLAEGMLTIKNGHYGMLMSRLKLLEEKNKAKIKANPHLLVADGKEAEMFVGEKNNIIINPDEDDSSRIEEIKVGMGLKIAVDIIKNDKVSLTIKPELSHFIDQMRPDVIVRENSLKTTLQLKSGQTAVLAGMTMSNDATSDKGIPVLNKIPLLRWFFKSYSQEEDKRELVVLVTPVVK